MHGLGVVFIDAITGLFFIGLVGSAVVVIISFIEDFHELFDSDDSVAEPVRPPQSTDTMSTTPSLSASRSSAR
jgi:hypothetical protein